VSQPDLAAMLKQAQQLQEKLKQMQEEAAAKTVDAKSGGGMVKVTVDGALQLRRLEIDPALLASNDKAMLEDLIVVAINEGIRQAQNLVADEMGKLAGPLAGLKIPGFGTD
jgi:DNA-binding YbaB/EbfC family protein